MDLPMHFSVLALTAVKDRTEKCMGYGVIHGFIIVDTNVNVAHLRKEEVSGECDTKARPRQCEKIIPGRRFRYPRLRSPDGDSSVVTTAKERFFRITEKFFTESTILSALVFPTITMYAACFKIGFGQVASSRKRIFLPLVKLLHFRCEIFQDSVSFVCSRSGSA